jgi:hypothetical protein
MGKHVQVLQAKTVAERANTARQFVAATGLEVDSVFVDTVDDKFMHTMSAHPQWYYVVDASGVLRLKATPCEGGYDIDDVDRCLAQICEDA